MKSRIVEVRAAADGKGLRRLEVLKVRDTSVLGARV